MSTHTLCVDLPEPTYFLILEHAKQIGQTPEQIVVQYVTNGFQASTDDDPLLQLAGIFSAEVTDVGTQHDTYLGDELRRTHD